MLGRKRLKSNIWTVRFNHSFFFEKKSRMFIRETENGRWRIKEKKFLMDHIECDIWRISFRRMLSEQMISHAVCSYGYVCDSENRALKLFRVYKAKRTLTISPVWWMKTVTYQSTQILSFSRKPIPRRREKKHPCRQQIQENEWKEKKKTLNTFVVLSTY